MKTHILLLLVCLPLHATLAKTNQVISNPNLEIQWTISGSGSNSFRLKDPVSDRELELNEGVTPSLVLHDGELFDIGSTLTEFIPNSAGQSLTATITPNRYGLEGRWTVSLHEHPAYSIQTLTLTATRDLPIKEIVFLEATMPCAKIIGNGDGSVLRNGPFFLAIEHPLAKVQHIKKNRCRCALPRGSTLKAGQSRTYTFVIGITSSNQFRRGFMQYLESRRAKPYRPFVHYNSWYHLNIERPDHHMTEKECLETIDHIGRELTQKRDITLEAFVWDDGWDDHKTLWDFHGDFPNGFKPLREAGKRYGARMGVWMSPWGGYGTPKQHRLSLGQAEGYEINRGGFSMAGPKYGAAFRERCFNMMDEQGVVFFKFDGMGSGNVVKGAAGVAAADIDAVLELTRALRAKNPEVFISATVGTWPSPFWLLFVDSIWRQGDDTGFAGVGNGREQWITYKNAHTYEHIVRQAPCYPINSLMNGGLVIGERGDPARMTRDNASVRNEARTMAGSGTCLQELYIDPQLLTQPMWDAIAESIQWLRTKRDAFADIHWVGGDPAALVVYGWGGWSSGYGVLTLRNPSDQPATYHLDIIAALDLAPDRLKTHYTLTSPYNDQRIQTLTCPTARLLELSLQPFEVLSFDVAVAKDAQDADDTSHGSRPARKCTDPHAGLKGD